MYVFGIDIPLDVLFVLFILLAIIEFVLLVQAGRRVKQRCALQAKIEEEVEEVREKKRSNNPVQEDRLYPEVHPDRLTESIKNEFDELEGK
jgi:signal recognition particle subunit SEC65